MKKLLFIIPCILMLAGSTCKNNTEDNKCQIVDYNPNWSSLRQHQTPGWVNDLKFGIYCHWGAQTVQIENLNEDLDYLEAIERWKGEKFNAKEWADLFEAAGAQFGGPVAWHGTGILNWDSDITEWNSVNKGPGVDIFGELSTELRKKGMKIVSSFHTSRVWNVLWGPLSKDNNTYINPAEDNSAYGVADMGRKGDEVFDGWFDRITEAIDKYQPDLIWLDTGFGGTVGPELKGHFISGRLLPEGDNNLEGIKERYQQKLISHYFNKEKEWGKSVDITYKSHDVPPGIGIRDIEDGNLKGLQYDPWMADINMALHYYWPAPWFYNPENPFKDANTLVDMLIDMVSKNGRMLLNVPPKSDGSFPENAKKELLKIGEWLNVNGEAIYGTIPWVFFGEGPTEVTVEGHHAQGKNRGEYITKYTNEDIRFTQKDNFLYAICLDWPGEELGIRALGYNGKLYPNSIKSISLLGYDGEIEWKQEAEALIVKFPDEPPCNFAYSLKIERE